MYTEEQAKNIFLKYMNKDRIWTPPMAVRKLSLSERNDFWIVDAYDTAPNSSKCGVWGYLVNNLTGKVIVCGSDQRPEDYIQDKYDEDDAQGKSYVVKPVQSGDKVNILKLKKIFGVTYSEAIFLLRKNTNWLQGKKRHLELAQKWLLNIDVPTVIELIDSPEAVAEVSSVYWRELEVVNDIKNGLAT